jgi:hypothetical protein
VHRHLDDASAPCPSSLWLSGLCEAFPGRLPTEILAEMRRLPVGTIEDLLEAGAYRQAKRMTDDASTPAQQKALPQTPLFDLVKTITVALVREEMDRKRRG